MQRGLPGGLVLRTLAAGHARDRERLPELYRDVFLELDDWDSPDDDIWVDNMLDGAHPSVTDEDVWLVVDPARDDLPVATLMLIPLVWRYETVPLGVGRIGLVATRAEYRRRGIMRVLMAAAHTRSAALGHALQSIVGIPHFYRRFGYTLAVPFTRRATVPLTAIPALRAGAQPFCTLRPAQAADYALYNSWDEYLAPRLALSAISTAQNWTHWLTHRDASLHTLIASDGTPLGYVPLWRPADDESLMCETLVVGPESSLLAIFEDVLRGIGEVARQKWPGESGPKYIAFVNVYSRTLMTLLEKAGPTAIEPHPYTWYLRASDPARLLQTLRPVLERRLEHSGAHRYSGELKISFYNMQGLKLRLEEGCLAEVQSISVGVQDELTCDAWITQEAFLNLVCGYHSFTELRQVLPETRANGRALALLEILFPRKPSYLLDLN